MRHRSFADAAEIDRPYLKRLVREAMRLYAARRG